MHIQKSASAANERTNFVRFLDPIGLQGQNSSLDQRLHFIAPSLTDLQKKLESEEKKNNKNKEGWDKAKDEIKDLNKVNSILSNSLLTVIDL